MPIYRSYDIPSSALKLARERQRVRSFVDARKHELSIPPRGREYLSRFSPFLRRSLLVRYTENNEIKTRRRGKKQTAQSDIVFFFSNYLLSFNELARGAH